MINCVAEMISSRVVGIFSLHSDQPKLGGELTVPFQNFLMKPEIGEFATRCFTLQYGANVNHTTWSPVKFYSLAGFIDMSFINESEYYQVTWYNISWKENSLNFHFFLQEYLIQKLSHKANQGSVSNAQGSGFIWYACAIKPARSVFHVILYLTWLQYFQNVLS